MKSWSILQENKSDDSLFFIASINILSELRGNVREKSKNSTGKHFHQAQLCPVFHFHKKSIEITLLLCCYGLLACSFVLSFQINQKT